MATSVVPYSIGMDSIDLGSFTLIIEGSNWQALCATAEEFRENVVRDFNKKHWRLSLLYNLVLEETDVREGSRRSKIKGRLIKKDPHPSMIGRWLTGLMTALTLASTDYNKVQENYHAVVTAVAHAMSHRGKPVKVADYQTLPLPPWVPRRDDPRDAR